MATNDSHPDDLSLEQRLYDLPPELYNMVQDLVLLTPGQTGGQVLLDANYKPPMELSISPSTRDAFAANYYSTTALIISYTPAHKGPHDFLVSLPPNPRQQIRCLCMSVDHCEPELASMEVFQWLAMLKRAIEFCFGARQPCADPNCLFTEELWYEPVAVEAKSAQVEVEKVEDKKIILLDNKTIEETEVGTAEDNASTGEISTTEKTAANGDSITAQNHAPTQPSEETGIEPTSGGPNQVYHDKKTGLTWHWQLPYGDLNLPDLLIRSWGN